MVDNCGRAYQGQDAMQITSLDNARLKEALDRDRLNLPKQPRVLEVRSELGADSIEPGPLVLVPFDPK